jgi:mono/diheme cytochrome c family protein
MLTAVRNLLAVSCFAVALSAQVTDLPPLPSELPPALQAPPAAPAPAIRRPLSVIRPQNSFPIQQPPARSYQPSTVPDDVLSWDSLNKEFIAKPGDTAANFTFSLTNVSKTNVVINWVRPSCGCTVAKLPPTPWTLASGESGNIDLTVDLRNKYGVLSKYVSVDTSGGQKLLNLKITIPANPQLTGAPAGADARTRNMQMAMADRQSVFKGDCASCHATPTVGKKGEQLYAAACGVCHDAPHRATMVPDLRALKKATGADYWAQWVTNGKPGTLMPAFAKAQGGPLDQEQIKSLAEFLDTHFPKAPAGTATAANTATISAGNVPTAIKN